MCLFLPFLITFTSILPNLVNLAFNMSITQLLKEKWYPPAERTEPFTGQVVLITGANSGLGLEAAKKVAALKADKLIITTRSVAKGEATKKTITKWLVDNGATQTTELISLVLDMSTSAGIKTFVGQLNTTTRRLDSAILNAGVSLPNYRRTPDGFEETFAVNTIDTTFLATLLLPLLLSTSKSNNTVPHLSIISSRNARLPFSLPNIPAITSSSEPLKVMSQHEHFPPGVMGGFIRYGQSKLMLEYAIRRLAILPALYSNNHEPLVIINTVCPGATKSDLGQHYEHWLARSIKVIMDVFFTKSTSAGANAYLTALSQGKTSLGEMWANDEIIQEWPHLTSADGKAMGDKVWNEMQALMRAWDKGVDDVLETKA